MTATQDNPALERIEQEINDHPVVLFMKGTPIFPQCGFSAMCIQVLTQMGAKFKSIDVLNEPTIRDGIKQYSDWPTIPQLYVKGEFIGGSDIVREMYESGELADLFSNKGVELEDA